MSLFAKKSKVMPSMLCVQIESGQRIWYEIDEKKPVSQVFGDDNADADAKETASSKPYISVTRKDYRVKVKQTLNKKDALSALVRSSESFDQLSVINESKLGVVYGTQVEHLKDETGHDVGVFSLFEITDKILRAANHPDGTEGLVIYQLVKDDGSDLLIFMNINELGALSYKAAIFEEDSTEAINLHISASGFKSDVATYEVDKNGLFQALHSLDVHVYPIEVPLISKQNIDAITPFVAGVAFLGLVGVSGWVFLNQSKLDNLNSELSAKEVELASIGSSIGDVLKSNPIGYAKLSSVDFSKVFSESESLYMDTSSFSVVATPTLRSYTMKLQVKSGTGRIKSVLNGEELLVEAITRKIEAPCTMGAITFSGDLNEVKTNYSCTSVNPSLRDIGL